MERATKGALAKTTAPPMKATTEAVMEEPEDTAIPEELAATVATVESEPEVQAARLNCSDRSSKSQQTALRATSLST